MKKSIFNSTLDGYSLVLGCGRLGSLLTPMSKNQGVDFIKFAYESGIRKFDTANIYGQGDSERIIGRALKSVRDKVEIASKAGQILSRSQKTLLLLKPTLRAILKYRSSIRQVVVQNRSKALNFNFDPKEIEKNFENSLNRLGTDYLDIFYLHSPPAEVFENEELMILFEKLKKQGKVRRIGISIDDPSTILSSFRYASADVLQLDCIAMNNYSTTSGVDYFSKNIILRGFISQSQKKAQILSQLAQSPYAHLIEGILTGTTNRNHLLENQIFASSILKNPL